MAYGVFRKFNIETVSPLHRGVLRLMELKKQSQSAGLWPEA